jgi:hypothetical protein
VREEKEQFTWRFVVEDIARHGKDGPPMRSLRESLLNGTLDRQPSFELPQSPPRPATSRDKCACSLHKLPRIDRPVC